MGLMVWGIAATVRGNADQRLGATVRLGPPTRPTAGNPWTIDGRCSKRPGGIAVVAGRGPRARVRSRRPSSPSESATSTRSVTGSDRTLAERATARVASVGRARTRTIPATRRSSRGSSRSIERPLTFSSRDGRSRPVRRLSSGGGSSRRRVGIVVTGSRPRSIADFDRPLTADRLERGPISDRCRSHRSPVGGVATEGLRSGPRPIRGFHGTRTAPFESGSRTPWRDANAFGR